MAGWAGATETDAPPLTTTTQLIVKLATHDVLPIQTQFVEEPPTIVLLFPEGRVAGSLPERSVVERGIIEEIRTFYAPGSLTAETRWIKALHIELRGAYPHEVRSEAGRIIVQVEHPADLGREAIQVGVAGGTVITGAPPQRVSERFQAMQDALMGTGPQPATVRAQGRQPVSSQPAQPAATGLGTQAPRTSVQLPRQRSAMFEPRPASRATTMGWWFVNALVLLCGGLWLWRRWRRTRGIRQVSLTERTTLQSAGFRLIDQLVWQAFERRGYQLLHTVEFTDHPLGVIRVIVKDGLKAALLCVGDGTFFEKATVERFRNGMRQARMEQGFLVAPGSFTVPAQRCAKDYGITLIGREQLTELLSEGATSEFYTKQLQQLQRQVDESKETLSQYAEQLDMFRRQRNEASWFLGEERAQSAKLEEELASLRQQLHHWQAQAEHWQQTAQTLRKQWEENQWYLGEAKASVAHLEEQVRTLQAASEQLEQRCQEITRKRDEAEWYLGEERAANETTRQQSQALTGQLTQTQAELTTIRQDLEEHQRQLDTERTRRQMFEAEVAALRTYGERRRALRLYPTDVAVELQDITGAPLFQGQVRDLSRTGVGIDATQPLKLPELLQVRLQLPGCDRPLESTGRVVWQGHDAVTQRYRGGCQLCDLSTESRDIFERALTSLSSAQDGHCER